MTFPRAHLVPLEAPMDETYGEFWERKAKERAQTIRKLMDENQALREQIRELEEDE